MMQNDGDLAGWHATIAWGELATVPGHRLTEDDWRRRAAIRRLTCTLEFPAPAHPRPRTTSMR
jgi:hypothetical protein